jgi:hypothetical protein
VGVVAIAAYLAPLRLAYSDKSGRALLPMLQYSARAQLVIGAALAVLLATNTYWG